MSAGACWRRSWPRPPDGAGRGARSAHLTPATGQRSVAEDWFERFEGAGLDGVVAKPRDLAYVQGKRVMVKVKHERTAEFVVGGFRWYRPSSSGGGVAPASGGRSVRSCSACTTRWAGSATSA